MWRGSVSAKREVRTLGRAPAQHPGAVTPGRAVWWPGPRRCRSPRCGVGVGAGVPLRAEQRDPALETAPSKHTDFQHRVALAYF